MGNIVRLLFGRLPWQAWAVAAVLAAAGLWHWQATHAAYKAGRADALADVRSSNEHSGQLASQAADGVEACYAKGMSWAWDRRVGKCVEQH